MPEIRVFLGDTEVSCFAFDKDVVSIGRSRDNDISIENLSVSRNHARIRREEDGKFLLTDLNSANGTFVNGVKVSKTEIIHGDTIQIGKHRLKFEDNKLSDEALIVDAFGAERTMIVEKTPEARLVVLKGKQQGHEFKIVNSETTIGRAKDNDICLSDWFLSRRHATIVRQGQSFFIKDNGSWKGTAVNDKQTKESPLATEDRIKVGNTVLLFHLAPEDQAPRLEGRAPVELGFEPPAEPDSTAGAVPAAPAAAAAAAVEVEPPVAGRPAAAHDEVVEVELPPKASEVVSAAAVEAHPPAASDAQHATDDLWTTGHMVPLFAPIEPEAAAVPPQSVEPEAAAVEIDIPLEPPPTPSAEPVSELEPPERHDAEPAILAPEPPCAQPASQPPPAPAAAPPPASETATEIALWERALRNTSPVVRKEARRMLRKLTGRDYDA